MNKRYHSRDGFTLVEMLGALLLVGILAAFTGMLLAPMAQTFFEHARSRPHDAGWAASHGAPCARIYNRLQRGQFE